MSDIDLRAALQETRDRQEITNQLHRYCRALDRMDRPLLESVFHADSTHEMGAFKGLSMDFCQFAFDILSGMEKTQHLLGNVLIELDGDKAVSECYFVAYHRIAADAPAPEGSPHRLGVDEDLFIAGRYLDRFEKRDGVWRVANRVGVQDWSRWEAVDEQGFPNPGNRPVGKRGKEDPSYNFF
jgi:hypothetical protein